MRIFIRVDASTQIGLGHLIRCRTVAEELRSRGADVRFICRAHPGHAAKAVEEKGFQILTLPPPAPSCVSGSGYDAWLGVSQETDAAETIAAMGATPTDWLIVDHYGLDVRWERIMRPHAARIMVIDDLANRHHDCDVLLDQNFGMDAPHRYDTLIPSACLRLLGPRYALLSPEYRSFKPRPRDKVERVLLSFGGADIGNATGFALEALSAPELSHLHVDVVVGLANPHRDSISAQADRRGRTVVYDPRPQLADLMSEADLAIGAGGGTTWERLCLGLPTLSISIAENQEPASRALGAAGFIDYAGPLETLTLDGLRIRIASLIHDRDRLLALSAYGPSLVDGLGALRVAETLIPARAAELRLRSAVLDDASVFFGWVNDPEARKQSLNPAPVTWDTHLEWFRKRLADSGSQLLVLETPDRLPIGQIRFDTQGDGAIRLSYMLDPIARGRGWASILVRMGLKALDPLSIPRVYAEVKTANLASCAVFDRLGFRHEDLEEQDLRIYRAAKTDI